MEAASKRTLMHAEGKTGAGSFLSKGPCSLTLGKNEVSLMREARSFAQAGRSRGRGGYGYSGYNSYRGRGYGRGYSPGSYRPAVQSQATDIESVLAKLLMKGGGASQGMRNNVGSAKTLRCFKCNETSHLAKQCPN